jgi:hypothetical protein
VSLGCGPSAAKATTKTLGSLGRLKMMYVEFGTYKFEYDEQNVVNDERPLSAIPIGSNTKEDRAHRTKHQNECDSPGNIGNGFVKGCREVRGC